MCFVFEELYLIKKRVTNTPLPLNSKIERVLFIYVNIFFSICGNASTQRETVKAHHLLASECLYSSSMQCEAGRATLLSITERPQALVWNAKHRVNPVFTLPVSFDKIPSELTYGNLGIKCLHTAIISASHHPISLG